MQIFCVILATLEKTHGKQVALLMFLLVAPMTTKTPWLSGHIKGYIPLNQRLRWLNRAFGRSGIVKCDFMVKLSPSI